jgi:hypothetical protein
MPPLRLPKGPPDAGKASLGPAPRPWSCGGSARSDGGGGGGGPVFPGTNEFVERSAAVIDTEHVLTAGASTVEDAQAAGAHTTSVCPSAVAADGTAVAVFDTDNGPAADADTATTTGVRLGAITADANAVAIINPNCVSTAGAAHATGASTVAANFCSAAAADVTIVEAPCI